MMSQFRPHSVRYLNPQEVILACPWEYRCVSLRDARLLLTEAGIDTGCLVQAALTPNERVATREAIEVAA